MNNAALTDEIEIMAIDEDPNASVFWEIFANEFFPKSKVTTSNAGYDALECIQNKQGRFDVLLCSWELRGLSGYIFMQKARENSKYRHTPFVMFSHLLTQEATTLLTEFGINHCFVKPYNKEAIAQKIKDLILFEKNLDSNQKLMRKVQEYLDEGKPTEALKFVSELAKIKSGPHLHGSLLLQGEVWLRVEKLPQAEQAFREAQKLNPTDQSTLQGIAKVMLKTGLETEAIAILEKLQKDSPKSLTRMLTLGDAYMGAGQINNAEMLFKEMQKFDAENREAQEGLGKVAFSQGQLEIAAKLFKESGKGEQVARWLNNIGIAKVKNGNHNDAIEIYKNASVVLPNDEKTKLIDYNIALAFYKSNRLADAVQAFASALEKDGQYEKAKVALLSSIKEARQKQIKLPNESRLKYLLGKEFPEAS